MAPTLELGRGQEEADSEGLPRTVGRPSVCYVDVDDGLGGVRLLAERGFEWGVTGADLTKLAALMLQDAVGDDVGDPRRFVVDVLALLPPSAWTLTEAQIEEWVRGSGRAFPGGREHT